MIKVVALAALFCFSVGHEAKEIFSVGFAWFEKTLPSQNELFGPFNPEPVFVGYRAISPQRSLPALDCSSRIFIKRDGAKGIRDLYISARTNDFPWRIIVYCRNWEANFWWKFAHFPQQATSQWKGWCVPNVFDDSYDNVSVFRDTLCLHWPASLGVQRNSLNYKFGSLQLDHRISLSLGFCGCLFSRHSSFLGLDNHGARGIKGLLDKPNSQYTDGNRKKARNGHRPLGERVFPTHIRLPEALLRLIAVFGLGAGIMIAAAEFSWRGWCRGSDLRFWGGLIGGLFLVGLVGFLVLGWPILRASGLLP